MGSPPCNRCIMFCGLVLQLVGQIEQEDVHHSSAGKLALSKPSHSQHRCFQCISSKNAFNFEEHLQGQVSLEFLIRTRWSHDSCLSICMQHCRLLIQEHKQTHTYVKPTLHAKHMHAGSKDIISTAQQPMNRMWVTVCRQKKLKISSMKCFHLSALVRLTLWDGSVLQTSALQPTPQLHSVSGTVTLLSAGTRQQQGENKSPHKRHRPEPFKL